jgi:ribonuclease HII
MSESISDIKRILENTFTLFSENLFGILSENTSFDILKNSLEHYKKDTRKGVIKMVEQYTKKISSYEQEWDRLYKLRAYERKYDSLAYICGIDEAGRGPLCGPVVAAAVILPKDLNIIYVDDSKKLSEERREELFNIINEKAIAVGVGTSSVEVIDQVNILNATYLAMEQAIASLQVTPEVLLIDAVSLKNVSIQQEAIIKGDAKSASIAAASIIAKVTRDRMLRDYSELYPEYHFEKNKGYGTKDHIEAIKTYGPCPIHRTTFIKNFIEFERRP